MMSLGEIMCRVGDGMTKEEASALLQRQVGEAAALGDDPVEALKLFRLNIGYFAQYFDKWDRDRAYELFDTEHPIWGKEDPTPEDIQTRFEHERRIKERS